MLALKIEVVSAWTVWYVYSFGNGQENGFHKKMKIALVVF